MENEIEKSLENFDKSKEINVGRGIFKLRVKGENKGKSRGYRLYVLVIEINKIISPICIYAKSDLANIKMDELTRHLKLVNAELNE